MQEGVTTAVTANGYAVAAFVAYLVLVIGIGIYATRFSSAGISEFFVGGRKMHRFVVALSAVVSGRSAWLLLGVTGMAYARGVGAVWSVVGYIVVELLLFFFYAPRLRRFAGKHDCITVPDFFAARFQDRTGSLRILIGTVILIFMVSYVSSQFVAGGKAIGASFGLSNTAGIILTTLIVLIYTALGGFLAVSLTDTVQGVVMIIALVVLPAVAISAAGGLGPIVQQLSSFDPTLIDPYAVGAGAIIGGLGIGLGSPGNTHIIVRYMSIDDPEQLRYSAVVGTVWNVVMAWGALFIGLAGRYYFPDAAMLPAGDPENLYPALAQQHLHPIMFGVVVASIFAAIMSTADSQLLVATSTVIRDVYEKVIRKGEALPQKTLVLYSRIVVVVLVVLALAMGMIARQLVFWLVLFAWAGLGAALGPTSLLAMFWKRTTRQGIAAGVVVGTVVTIVWNRVPALKEMLYELVPAFLLALIATVVVSVMTTPPDGVDEMFRDMGD